MTDKELPWSDEVRRRLVIWGAWARKNGTIDISAHPIAAMMKANGTDLSVPFDLTEELDVTEKAIARMRNLHPVPRRIIIDHYLHYIPKIQMAGERRWSDRKMDIEIWRAESIVGRYMTEIERERIEAAAIDKKK